MEIKNIISEFVAYHNEIEVKVDALKKVFHNEDEYWQDLDRLDKSIIISDRIMNLLGDSLQMVNDQTRLETYDLIDIKTIYQLLVNYYPDNIEYRIDLISFVHNVLNDEQESQRLILETLKFLEVKKEVFNKFIRDISSDDFTPSL